MLDSGLPAAIVVGRTLSVPQPASSTTPPLPSYFVGEVQNHQVTITYTVYNEQADPETGVLLTTTLEPGVTIASASQQPDQNSQNLAWSLGTIQGFDRVSVSLTVNLSDSSTTQLDTGARAFATLDGGAVSNTTPAATLKPGNVSDPSLLVGNSDPSDPLSSSLDQNDPFIQEEAAALNYDPTQIFNFLHTEIGYNSYLGSVRGARGTLWSMAGNALDVSNLGVALMRASGIPAQYVQGMLSQAQAQQLILTMFPPQDQTVGYVLAGTQTSDPANDPQLLSETESHDWFQFDAGNGMENADPLMPGATIGQAFTSATGTFTGIPSSSRETTEVQVVAEIDNTADSLFGLSGLTETTVLDQTFNDVDLVGHPLTLGNFVSQSSAGFVISATTNTYTPYLLVGDEANPDPSQDEVIEGTPYQEVLTNFPLGSQILTGLFLNMTLSGPQGPAETSSRTLFDRIGYAARQNGGSSSLNISASGAPALSPLQVWSIGVQASLQDPTVIGPLSDQAQADADSLANLASAGTSPDVTEQAAARDALVDQSTLFLATLLATSDSYTALLATSTDIVAYFARPRIAIMGASQTVNGSKGTELSFEADLRRDTIRAVAPPGQATSALAPFQTARGLLEDQAESSLFPQPPAGGQVQVVYQASASDVFNAAAAQGIPIIALTASNQDVLQTLAISADAKAEITTALQQGDQVIVPASSPTIDGVATDAWYQVNPTTGELIGVGADGAHQGLVQYAALGVVAVLSVVLAAGPLGSLAADLVLNSEFEKYRAGLPQVEIPEFGGQQAQIDYQNAKSKLKQQILDDMTAAITRAQSISLPIFKEAYITELNTDLLSLKVFLSRNDPPLPPTLLSATTTPLFPANVEVSDTTIASNMPAGSVAGTAQITSLAATSVTSASWADDASSAFQAATLTASGATVVGPGGAVVGCGTVALAAGSSTVGIAVSGEDTYQVSGSGSLSFYGPAGSSLGVSADWTNYNATVTGSVTLTLTTSSLMLNGVALPAGTYTIKSASAMLGGSGPSTSPDFSGAASLTASGSTVNLGPGAGSLTVGGKPLGLSGDDTLTGYTGTLAVSAAGNGTDSVSISGSTTDAISVAASATAVTADQNTPATFQINVATTLADTYAIGAQAPLGWTLTVGANGQVTALPAPGLQSGTYPIAIDAQSTTNPDLITLEIVDVTVTPTAPGLALSVAQDTEFSVPFHGAQVPTAFRATIQNLGPAADTYDLTVSNLPSGFTLGRSATTDTVPAGRTGIVGLYLLPTGTLPAPGTQLSFTVTATSTTNPTITQTQTETFTVPAIDAITVSGTPPTLDTSPGTPITDTLTITNAGNVAESNVALTSTLPSGLTLNGLSPVSLQPGQSTTQTVTLTPASSTPLNSALQATITATYGPAASPLTQTITLPITVEVPGASAIASAATSASLLGDGSLADQLNDLSTALTDLVQNPADPVAKSQTLASLTTVTGLLGADPFLAQLVSTFSTASAAISAATTSAPLLAAANTLGTALDTLGTTLSEESGSKFTLSFLANSQVGRPQVPATYQLVLQNTGSQSTTYDLSVSGLPAGVTATLSQPKITLGPGQVTPGTGQPNLTVTVTSTSATNLLPFNFQVTATAEGAPAITQSIVASFAVPPALVEVVGVTPKPAFTQPGGVVDVSARLLNAVNQQQQAEVSYTVTDPSDKVIFTSQPVTTTTLQVLTTLSTVDLGNLDTTGFALGDDTINVTVADASGNPIPGATGTGTLLIGTPVSATLVTTPTSLPPGSGMVTSTLQINSQTSFTSPLTLAGETPISGASGVAVDGTLAYTGAGSGIDVVDVSDPTNPKVLSTFATSDFPGMTVKQLQVTNGELVVLTQDSSATNQSLLIYSLANPSAPTLLGQTPITVQGSHLSHLSGFVISNNHVFINSFWYRYDTFSNQIFAQFGEDVDIDISNPAAPAVANVIYNDSPDASTGYPDGTSNIWQGATVNNNVLLLASTTATGATVAGVQGLVTVVNTTDPSNPSVIEKLTIPGMGGVTGISVQGNRAMVIGSSQYWGSGISGLTGNVVVAMLDLTDPTNPTVISSQTLGISAIGISFLQSLGNNLYVTDGFATQDTSEPALLVFDASNPQNVVETTIKVPNTVNGQGYMASGGYLDTVDGSSFSAYQLGAATSIPVTAELTIPVNQGVSVVPSSFSLAPTTTTTNPDGSQTLTWDLGLSASNPDQSITFNENVTRLEPGQSLPVEQNGTVTFTSQGATATLNLPDQNVTGDEIIGLSPTTLRVAPGAAASYTVNLSNPTASAVTYNLSVQGVPAGWVSLPATVTIAANGTANVPLTLTSNPFAVTGNDGFTVSASDAAGASASVQGTLILQGQPVAPDPQSHGVVVATRLSRPTQLTAGQGTTAR